MRFEAAMLTHEIDVQFRGTLIPDIALIPVSNLHPFCAVPVFLTAVLIGAQEGTVTLAVH